MSNDYYNHGGYPSIGAAGASASARAEFDAIMAGFNKMPVLAGGALKLVRVNAGGTALESTSSIDSVVIGGTTPAAGTFTTLAVTGNTTLGDTQTDTLSIGGSLYKTSAGAWTIPAPSAGDTLVVNSLTGQVSVRGGVVSSTNNPRFEFWHTESSGLTVLDFTGSVGPSARIAIGGAPCIDITPYRNISIAAPSSGDALIVTAAASSARVADFSGGTDATRTIRLPGNITAGEVNGSYGSIGYNWDGVASSSTMNYRYIAPASRLLFSAGGFIFQTAPSGTAGNPITFTNAVTIAQGGTVTIAAPSSSSDALTVTGVGVPGTSAGVFTHSSADASPSSLNLPSVCLDNTNTTNGNYSGLMFRSVTSGGAVSYGAMIAGIASGKTAGGYDMALHFYTRNAAGTVLLPLTLGADGGTSTGRLTASGSALTPTSSQAFTATPTFNAALANIFEFSGAMTANVTSCTISNATAGQTISIRVIQDATGSRTFAAPAGAKITGSVGATASAASILTLTYSSMSARWEGSWLPLPV